MNQPVICAELQGVLTFNPGDIVDEIVNGYCVDRGAVLRIDRTQCRKVDVCAVAGSAIAAPLPNVAVAERVNEIVPDNPGVIRCDPFGVVRKVIARGLAGKFRRPSRWT